jgi:hypothetical protein
MRLRVDQLILSCHKGQEIISFAQISYFYGQMGAGKSSIVRLVDYAFGGRLEATPAMQHELVAVTLAVRVSEIPLTLERRVDSEQVRASWNSGADNFDVLIPARRPGGEVIPGTGVEVLSDLIFYIAGTHAPKVRRSKIRDDSELARLSFRDLYVYCYLDQDSMDSDFFRLDSGDWARRQKSKDVLRFIIGFHQQRVAELEMKLEKLKVKRTVLELGAESLRDALDSVGVSTPIAIAQKIENLQAQARQLQEQIKAAREDAAGTRTHAAERLRSEARALAAQCNETTEAVAALEKAISADRRHSNELKSLSMKYRRTSSARAVLAGVEFVACPRCAQKLPPRSSDCCHLCGQHDGAEQMSGDTTEQVSRDVQARELDLEDAIARRSRRLAELKTELTDLEAAKAVVDADLDAADLAYDSAYLSRIMLLERSRVRVEEQVKHLHAMKALPQKVNDQLAQAQALEATETPIRVQLKTAREAAERDNTNLKRLEALFLDCLIRAHVPGFSAADLVHISNPHFLPEVANPNSADMVVTSFSNMGSGGKKTLFKSCFALALHRLAAQIDAELPTIVVVDSSMKNISERENVTQFEGFYALLFELAATELRGTQFIVIDKEYFGPASDLGLDLFERHMTPDDPSKPPLFRNYRGA